MQGQTVTSSHFPPTHLTVSHTSPCLYIWVEELINDSSDSVSNVWIVSVTCQIVSFWHFFRSWWHINKYSNRVKKWEWHPILILEMMEEPVSREVIKLISVNGWRISKDSSRNLIEALECPRLLEACLHSVIPSVIPSFLIPPSLGEILSPSRIRISPQVTPNPWLLCSHVTEV